MRAHNLWCKSCFVSCHVLFQETRDLPCQKTIIHPCVQRCPACPCFSGVGRMHELVVCDKERNQPSMVFVNLRSDSDSRQGDLWKQGIDFDFHCKNRSEFQSISKHSVRTSSLLQISAVHYLACFVLFLSWVRSMENVSWEPCISPNSRSFSEYGWAWRRKSARTC